MYLRLKPFAIGILTLLLALFLSSCAPVFGSSPIREVTLTQQEFETLERNFNELASINSEQRSSIEKLEQQLSIAKLSTSESADLIQKQQEQLKKASELLKSQQDELTEQSKSLAKAEAYLNQQEQELKKAKKRQRNSNLLIAGLAIGLVYTATK